MSHPNRSHPPSALLDKEPLIAKIDGIDNQLTALRHQHTLLADLCTAAIPQKPILYIEVQAEALGMTHNTTAEQIEAIQSQLSEVRHAVWHTKE